MSAFKSMPYLPVSFSLVRDVLPLSEYAVYSCQYKRYLRMLSRSDPTLKTLSQMGFRAFVLGSRAHEYAHLWMQEPGDLVSKEANLYEGLDESEKQRLKKIALGLPECEAVLRAYGLPTILPENHKGTSKVIGSARVYGKIDGRIIDVKQKFGIVDLKTGHSHPDRRQAFIYALLHKGTRDFNRTVIFFNIETREMEIVDVTDADEKVAFEQIQYVHHRVQREHRLMQDGHKSHCIYVPNSGPACLRCEFRTVCKFSSKSMD